MVPVLRDKFDERKRCAHLRRLSMSQSALVQTRKRGKTARKRRDIRARIAK